MDTVADAMGFAVSSVIRPVTVDGSCASSTEGRSASAATLVQSQRNSVFVMCLLREATGQL
jgi:hypothetical protein